jgi:poly(A) polymerase
MNLEIGALKKSKVLEAVHRLAQRRKERVYLVGGAVRDVLMGRPWGKDFDFAVAGDVEGLAKEAAEQFEGHAFPLEEALGTWRVTLKKKRKKTDLDFSRLQGKDILEDLRKRDFTVNSMAVALRDLFQPGTLCPIDPLDGLGDLNKKVLRADSEEALRQDPLRLLRAFRFCSTLQFSMEEETRKMIRRNKELIRQSAGERVRAELFIALAEEGGGLFLRRLHQAGLLQEIFPEVRAWEGLSLGTKPPFSLLDHALRAVEAAEFIFFYLGGLYPSWGDLLKNHFSQNEEEGVSRKALFKFIAFFHDSGKTATASQDQRKGSPRFLDHDREGAKINTAIGRRLKLSRRSVRILSELTRQHMRVQGLVKAQELTGRAKYRFFQDLGREGLDLAVLSLANALASGSLEFRWPFSAVADEGLKRVQEISEELVRYYFTGYTRKPGEPLLDGKEVMQALGIPQGEAVGMILGKLREAEISGTVRTKEEALQFLKAIPSSTDSG